ncbi:hypothetical protein ALQ63_02888 [Serratia plymuthica]|uniref:hypothetical protein n=1 Tax=Serratia plymuthica TaxID=82996 RepID=UPI000F3F2C0A|nr:hypothetical protein [Serratia plymuthica]RMN18569.1 hypothetical protein ALQ63_02888 [Serratia plymuthica]
MTLTTEWLKERLKNPRSGTEFELINEVLANREAQPVAYLKKSIIDSERFDSADPEIILHPNTPEGWHSEYQAGFTAPPAPVVNSQLTGATAVPDDYFGTLVKKARSAADKAMRKFPQPNYVLNKVAEESGEVIKAVIHYTEGREEWANVEGEIIDNLAMLIRLVVEGDQVIGFTPPDSCRAAMLAAAPEGRSND